MRNYFWTGNTAATPTVSERRFGQTTVLDLEGASPSATGRPRYGGRPAA